MKTLACIAVVVVAAAAVYAAGNFLEEPVSYPNKFELIQPDLDPEYKPSLPKAYGIRTCGGYGKFVALRVKACSTDSICKYPADGKQRPWEIEFIPKEDTNAIGIRVVLLVDGTSQTVFERAIASSEVEGGKRYVLSSTGAALDPLKGKKVTSQAIIYRVNDNNVEICLEMDTEIY